MTVMESHALAVIPQNPVQRHPLRGKDFAAVRARLERLLTEDADGGPREGPLPPLRVRSPARLPFLAPHVCAELLADSDASAPRGVMATGIEPDLQRLLEERLSGLTAGIWLMLPYSTPRSAGTSPRPRRASCSSSG